MTRKRGRRGKGRRTREMIGIARERIDTLFQQAEKAALSGRYDRSRRYVELARKIGMRYNVRIPQKYRMHYCRKCNSFLIDGVNAEYRLNSGKITVTCMNCGNVYRHPYRRERSQRT